MGQQVHAQNNLRLYKPGSRKSVVITVGDQLVIKTLDRKKLDASLLHVDTSFFLIKTADSVIHMMAPDSIESIRYSRDRWGARKVKELGVAATYAGPVVFAISSINGIILDRLEEDLEANAIYSASISASGFALQFIHLFLDDRSYPLSKWQVNLNNYDFQKNFWAPPKP